MYTPVAINATTLTEYALRPFATGPSALDRVLSLARRLADGAPVLVLARRGGPKLPAMPEGVRLVTRDTWTMGQGLSDMASLVSAADSEQYPRGLPILYLQGDSPFSDLELCERLLSIHKRFRAEYTFADGYPPGFAAEVLSSRCLPNLVELAARDDTASDSGTAGGIEREALFALIQKDMNAYDVETELAPIDMRVYRFSPT
ncbi:MAG TPA: hypothetical protein PLC54_05440, partial [Spirochaetales bacterium]|nr:hypothetical protein [Spirochaetales bacterium]